MASELESDPRDTVDWGRKWLVDFSAGKTQLVSFDWSNNTGAIYVKMDTGPNLDKNSIWLLDPDLFYENYKKLYFDLKHEKTGLNRGW